MAKVEEVFELTEIPGRQQDALARGDALARFRHECGNIAVKTSRGLRLHRARLNSLSRYTKLIKLQTCMMREQLIPIAGEKMRRNRIRRGIARILKGFFRIREELPCCFVDGFRLVENDDSFLAQIQQRVSAGGDARAAGLSIGKSGAIRRLCPPPRYNHPFV